MPLLTPNRGEKSHVPAIVVIIPVLAVTLRMRPFFVSAMKMLPVASTATSFGPYSDVLVAATLSETYRYPLLPFPATVVITPVLTVTFRIRSFPESAM